MKNYYDIDNIIKKIINTKADSVIAMHKLEDHHPIRIKKIARRIDRLDFFSDDQDDFSTSIFSEIIPTNLDKEGRFLIPDLLKKYSNISEEVTFIGQGYYFQIWEPDAAL